MYPNIYNYSYPYYLPVNPYDFMYQQPNYTNPYMSTCIRQSTLKDYGPKPFVINIKDATLQNNNYRTTLWTGSHMQLTLMSINPGEDIGLEIHPHVDQFLRIEDGDGMMLMGDSRNNLTFRERVTDDFIVLVPAGTWHNLINTGDKPLKLYSLYAPPQHPHGTIHQTQQIAFAAEKH